MSLKLLVPIVLILVIYVGCCFYDIWTSPKTKYLSKWVWSLICLLSFPGGGLLYFFLGRLREEESDDFTR